MGVKLCGWILTAGLVCGLSAPVAQAQARGKRTATLYMDHGDTPRLQSRTVGLTLERALKERLEFRFRRLADVLESRAAYRKQMAKARKLIKDAKTALTNMEVEKGVKVLQQAIGIREQYFHLLARKKGAKNKHAWLLGDLAMAHFMAGDEDNARQSLLQAFALYPKMEFDAKRFPPQMKRTFDESSFLADEMGTGNAQVTTDPPGCEVRANGAFVGFSPQVVRGMTAGRNLISLARTGYRTQTFPVKVEGGADIAQVTVELTALPGKPASKLKAALMEARHRKVGKNMLAAARRVKTDLLLLATLGGQDDLVVISMYAYNTRTKKVTGMVKGTASSLDPEPEVNELVATLVGTLAERPKPPPVKPRPPSESLLTKLKKFRESKYFWPVVGGIAATVVITSASVGIYYGTRGDGPDHRKTLLLLPQGTIGTF